MLAALLIALIPLAAALWVWLSPLAFVPVPWPDDSAFYFVGKHLVNIPPKWLMISQAPFEPTYREWNFNTMPLYPLMMGIGRLIGIDGSFAIKIYSLLPWALLGMLASYWVLKLSRSRLYALSVALLFALDPIHRWASVLVRPESFIALCGVTLVFGLSFGFPKQLKKWHIHHPEAALLALAAYAHFNAIHLLFPVVAAFWRDPKKLSRIAGWTTVYLLPWILTVVWHPGLFLHQMDTQWTRLSGGNDWLRSVDSFIGSLVPAYGSPEPWSEHLWFSGVIVACLLISACVTGILLLTAQVRDSEQKLRSSILPAAAWVWGAVWLWNSKPEIWFVFYLHIACWTFLAVLLVKMARFPGRPVRIAVAVPLFLIAALFMNVNLAQAVRLGATQTWNWDTYNQFVKCIDDRLSIEEARVGRPLKVWGPTFPDVLIELSRKHPSWEYTRTCDFMDRVNLAIKHGHEADAVVVTETLQWPERTIHDDWSRYPQVRSVWLDWHDYFLNRLYTDPTWKPSRYLCQYGRWMAFIFVGPDSNEAPATHEGQEL